MDNSIIVAIISGVFSVAGVVLGSYLSARSFEAATSHIKTLKRWARQFYLLAWVSFVFCLLGASVLIVAGLTMAFWSCGPIGFGLSFSVTGALFCALFFFLFRRAVK